MSRIESFAPLAAPHAHTLILGSMPGIASLTAGRYYAHPRNLFWPLLGTVLGIDPRLDYAERVRQLTAGGFAVWDVLGACRRDGSLDSRIAPDSIEPNDFQAFFAQHPRIDRVFFNGATAEQCFRRHVLPGLPASAHALALRRLPSTSPANAAIPLADKITAWRDISRPAPLAQPVTP